MSNKLNPIFWCKTSVIDEIVYKKNYEGDDRPFNHAQYEDMCKEPVYGPNGALLGYDHNYPYFVAYPDGTTANIFEKEFRKQFPGYKIPELELTDERREIIDSFILKVKRS